jgi:hypothetical protein
VGLPPDLQGATLEEIAGRGKLAQRFERSDFTYRWDIHGKSLR